jgi:FlaA1/EpsC-like NDP-sugar epimerase
MVLKNLGDWLLSLSRRDKRLIVFVMDVALCVWTVWAALYLRLEVWVRPVDSHWLAVLAAPVIAIPIFTKGGLYRAIFRYTGWPAMIAVVRACLLYGGIYSLIFTFIGVVGVPRTVGLIQPVLLFLAIATSRAAAHYLLGGNYRRILGRESGSNVLIYGAGASGRQLSAAVAHNSSMRVVAFIDDDASLHGASLDGKMIYPPEDIIALVERYSVSDVLLAIPTASRRRKREILEALGPAQVGVRILPGLVDLAQGRIEISELRSVEIEDLLGRDAVNPDQSLLEKNITDKVVLVTGGGGSIGSELCRQIFDLAPKALLVVESSEYALYTIHRELEDKRAATGRGPLVIPLLSSVLDEQRIRSILSHWKPATIYHAAAYKHVPLVEHNVAEGLKNNVFGTLTIARLAEAHGVADFVLISTDKAVRPTNVMGASKRLAEMVLQALAEESRGTRYSMVRFGNVLGSSGSVVPLFRRQISRGGPVTITHVDVTRYFMTVPEAAQLVIQAGAMAEGGEVFLLEMGEPVKIYDLAVNMINLSGLSIRDEFNPDGDIEITIVGLRPGEKLFEELLIGDNPMPTDHERIMQAREAFLPRARLEARLDKLKSVLVENRLLEALGILGELVPEYRAQGEVVDFLSETPATDETDLNAGIGGRLDPEIGVPARRLRPVAGRPLEGPLGVGEVAARGS